MPGWDEALDAMTTLAHAFKTAEHQEYIERFTENLVNSGKMYDVESGQTIDVNSSTADRTKIKALVDRAITHIDEAEPVWVNGDVANLIEFSAEHETFKPQAIYKDDLWSEHAFCLFETPLKTIDMRGLEFWYRAISWSMVTSGAEAERAILICKWAHRDDPDGLRELRGQNGKPPLLGGSPLRLVHVDQIPFGEDRFLREPLLSRSIAQYEALWRLAQQSVVLFARQPVSRYAFKRARKSWRAIKEVSILRLRRAHYKRKKGESQGEWELTYRTNTRAHWRGQYYPSLGEVGDPQAYRQIWIDEYIRGPEDGPLILKRHATEFVR